jgi:hypothetical protein
METILFGFVCAFAAEVGKQKASALRRSKYRNCLGCLVDITEVLLARLADRAARIQIGNWKSAIGNVTAPAARVQRFDNQ